MTPATPFMLEVLRRIDRDAHKNLSLGSNRAHAGFYPANTVKGLLARGLIEEERGMVSLTDAGRALIAPPVMELDDLVVLDSETARWPLDPRYYDVEPR